MEGLATLNSLRDSVEVDSECLEVLIPYLDKLLALGVDFSEVNLQQAIEGYIYHLEPACQAVIAQAGQLASQGERFAERSTATLALITALTEEQHPPENWQDIVDIAPQARYISPYELALRLIYGLQAMGYESRWQADALEILSDQEIMAILPEIEQDYAQIQVEHGF
jgi:hypothetical protein